MLQEEIGSHWVVNGIRVDTLIVEIPGLSHYCVWLRPTLVRVDSVPLEFPEAEDLDGH